MAIANVKKLTMVAPLSIKEEFLDKLYKLRLLHVLDAFPEGNMKEIKRVETETGKPENNIIKLKVIQTTFDRFVKKKKSLFENFFSIPVQVNETEFNNVLNTFNMETLFEDCNQIDNEYHLIINNISKTESELKYLSLFLELPYTIDKLKEMKNVTVRYGSVSKNRINDLWNDEMAKEILTCQVISSEKRIKILIFFLKRETAEATKLLEKYSFNQIPIPEITGTLSDRVKSLKSDLVILNEKLKRLKARVLKLHKHRKEVEITLSYWENEKEKIDQKNLFVSSKRTVIISGYIRETDIVRIEKVLKDKFPAVSTLYNAPDPQENIPVSIELNRFFRPAQLLTNMFGLPNYFSFDPTPFLTLGFLIFFGICFGDVVYGLMLMGISYYTMRKYRNYEDVKDFFALFFYAGISTAIIGVLTGGWAGDIYSAKYLGENNLLLRLRNTLMIIDPLARPIIALVFAIGLGVVNQFYGISLKMYGELRKGNTVNAVLDGALWLIFLPGITIITMPLFIVLPGWIYKTGLYMAAVSAVGLVVTQGRSEKTWIGRVITGLVSMYGILGSYGSVSFLSDILSYSRLLALGLTTTIVAMTFNIIAGIALSIDVIGIAAFIIILILGHTFNFLICLISSFVHPARLIFLEFFGRFYEGGAVKFQPYGFNSKRVQLINGR